jgi:hypothetical protein
VDDTDVVEEELQRLAELVLNGKVTRTIAGETRTLTPEKSVTAARYATCRTEIYEEETESVLKYSDSYPDDLPKYISTDREVVQDLAKILFQDELARYLDNYTEEFEDANGGGSD